MTDFSYRYRQSNSIAHVESQDKDRHDIIYTAKSVAEIVTVVEWVAHYYGYCNRNAIGQVINYHSEQYSRFGTILISTTYICAMLSYEEWKQYA